MVTPRVNVTELAKARGVAKAKAVAWVKDSARALVKDDGPEIFTLNECNECGADRESAPHWS